MKKMRYNLIAIGLLASLSCFAGNDRKRGQAGATELMMNPWAASSGWIGGSVAGISGAEAMRWNVAGIANTDNMNLTFANVQWYAGSGISSNALGFTTRVGDNDGVLGISLMSMDFGEFIETTTDLPEGTGSTFKPQFFNIGVAYSKKFSDRINGGILIRVINESIPNASASGVAVDAGVQYKGGARDRFKFGVSLRNVGDQMQYAGDGLSFRGKVNAGNQYSQTLQQRAAEFEIPTILNIASSYDFVSDETNKLTLGFNFNSHSFTSDRLQFGAQYAFKQMFFLRAGYDYVDGMLGREGATNNDIHTGINAGMGVRVKFGEIVENEEVIGSRHFSVDYAYRSTANFAGTHCIGITLDL